MAYFNKYYGHMGCNSFENGQDNGFVHTNKYTVAEPNTSRSMSFKRSG